MDRIAQVLDRPVQLVTTRLLELAQSYNVRNLEQIDVFGEQVALHHSRTKKPARLLPSNTQLHNVTTRFRILTLLPRHKVKDWIRTDWQLHDTVQTHPSGRHLQMFVELNWRCLTISYFAPPYLTPRVTRVNVFDFA